MPVRKAIVLFLIALTLAAVPLQFIIDASGANIASSCIVLMSSLVLLGYVGWTRAIDDFPLSTFALFGFCITTQLGALLAQTATWTALRNSLYDPLYTFGTLAFYLAIALAVHVVYRFFSVPKAGDVRLFRGLLGWAGIYRTPPVAALWLMGFLGLCTFFFTHIEGVVGKLALAFNFLAIAPFLLRFYLRREGASYCDIRVHRPALIVYALFAVLLGLALNTRAIMFSGVVTLALIYLLSGLRSHAPVTQRALLRLGVLAAVLIALSGPISDLATSMVIARQWRGKVSSIEMVRTTFKVWRNPSLIAAYKAEGETASKYRAYDEHYISNPLLARFINTKYHDNAFHFARALTTDAAKARLRDISIKLVWVGLPDPVLRALHIGVDKNRWGASMGDYLAYLGRGIPLGGHKIGSMFAQGIVIFGPLFPFVYAALCAGLFALLDLLSTRDMAGTATISTLGMLLIVSIFGQGLSYEGLHELVYLFMRNFAQMLLVYSLVFAAARTVVRSGTAPAAAVPKLPAWQHPL